jgi:hypothetical protein
VSLENTEVIAAKSSFISTSHDMWRAMSHVSAPEPTSEAGAVRSRRTRVSARPVLSDEVRFGAEGRVATPDPSWMVGQVQSLWARGSSRDLLGRGEGSGASDTWQRRSLHKLGGGFRCHGGMWQHVDAYLAFYLGLNHVRGGTRCTGYR